MAAIGASTDRNQDFLGAALSDGGCHGGGDFSSEGVCNDDADWSDD